tara:strand:+ start:182 stop:388 length:207 start_codon:yes stop_codon:yes gene_type:complete
LAGRPPQALADAELVAIPFFVSGTIIYEFFARFAAWGMVGGGIPRREQGVRLVYVLIKIVYRIYPVWR